MNWMFTNPISDIDVKKVEKKLNVSLPIDYIQQIININEGCLKKAYICTPELPKILYSKNLSLKKSSPHNIYDVYGYVGEGTRHFPFAHDDFGNYFCFDLKQKNVIFWEHESGKTFYLCDTFTELLNMIRFS